MNWEDLTQDEKDEFKKVCDKLFGKTQIFVEGGQPIYIDKDLYMIDTEPLMILITRKNKINKLLKNINYDNKRTT